MEVNVQNEYYFMSSPFVHWDFLIGAPTNGVSSFGSLRKTNTLKQTHTVKNRLDSQTPASSREQHSDGSNYGQSQTLPVRNRCSCIKGPERKKNESFQGDLHFFFKMCRQNEYRIPYEILCSVNHKFAAHMQGFSSSKKKPCCWISEISLFLKRNPKEGFPSTATHINVIIYDS